MFTFKTTTTMKVYKILSDTNRILLEEKVTRFLLQGFEPYGSLQVIDDTITEGTVYASYSKKVIRYIQPIFKTTT